MKQLLFLLALLIIPSVSSMDNLTVVNMFTGETSQLEPGPIRKCPQITSINNDVIREFCFNIQSSLIWTIVIVALLWIIEPIVKKKFSEVETDSKLFNHLVGNGMIPFVLKWIGIGLLFVVGYSLKTMM